MKNWTLNQEIRSRILNTLEDNVLPAGGFDKTDLANGFISLIIILIENCPRFKEDLECSEEGVLDFLKDFLEGGE
jgi:hypothetical protein